MLKRNKLAAIDIGTNALRLLITDVYKNGFGGPVFKKNVLYRVPVRLGSDAFRSGFIGEDSVDKLKNSLLGFHYLMKAHGVEFFDGCATSALREASNGQQIVDQINAETDVGLRIISGEEEAEIIFSTQISNEIDPNKQYLYVDVGGGSTELTFFKNGLIVSSRSFKIGTVRILLNTVNEDQWKKMRQWLIESMQNMDDVDLIGSGGNITRLFKMSLKAKKEPLSRQEIQLHYNYINQFSIEDRIKLLDLKPDRADVIIPAARIFLFVLDAIDANLVYVPKIGLADGIIKRLYKKVGSDF